MPRLLAANPKLATQHLRGLVEPDGLQKIMTAHREVHYKELRKDFQGFVKHLRERAVAYGQYNRVAKNAAGKKGRASGNGFQSNSGGSNGDGGGAGSTSQQLPASGGGGKGGKKTPPNKRTKDGDSANKQGMGGKKKAPECLNKKTFSGQKHWLSDCPKTSEEDKKKIRAEYKA
jgi:hypothetical protein